MKRLKATGDAEAHSKRQRQKETLKELLEAEELYIPPAQLAMLSEQLMMKAHQSIDIGYIRTLLFPELYSYDMPQPMSNISFCKFTDKQEGSITLASEGLLLWFPKTNYGPSIFVYNNAAARPTNWMTATSNLQVGGYQNYAQYFTQTALNAAAISIQYVGAIQQEQGFLCGSFVNGVNPNTIVYDDIENGQNKVLTNPSQGIRLVYMPKDQQDFGFYNTFEGTAHNQGTRPMGDEEQLTVPLNNALYTTASTWIGGSVPPLYSPTATKYAANTEYAAIYWKGVPQGQTIRVDYTRKFSATPKQIIRDIVDVAKPKRNFDVKKTIDVVNELQLAVPQMGGHTLKSMDRISDQIQQFLPNIGHLYSQGFLKDGLTLQGLAQQLQEAGLQGASTQIGKIWDE